MRKRKILFVTEAHFQPTGYAVYTKEVLSRLHAHPELEVAELACFVGPEAPELKNSPWKIYPNIPAADNHEAMNAYNSSISYKFGEFSLNHVLIDFKPDFVMDIRDVWMCLDKSTPIFTDCGIKNVTDIKEGDLVLTHKGNYQRVLNTFSRDYSGDMYYFKTNHNLYSVGVTTGHPVLICNKQYSRFHTKNAQWVNSENVREGDYLCFPVTDFGNISEPAEKSFLRAYLALFFKSVGKGVLKFKIPYAYENVIPNILECLDKLKVYYKVTNNKRCSKHVAFSLRVGRKFAENLYDFNNILNLDKLGSMHFAQTFITHRVEFVRKNKHALLKFPNEKLRDVLFRFLMRYGILSCPKRKTLRVSDVRSVSNIGFLSGKPDSSGIKENVRIRKGFAFLKIKSIKKKQVSDKVYNFEVEEDNSYVSSFVMHNCEHIERSPFRDFFNFALMPTVDAKPQHPNWMSVFSKADAILAYSEFGRDTILEQNKNINFVGVASPSASDIFVPMDKKQIRKEFNLDENVVIFGTVMRNQRRKLYPSLFKAFKMYLDNNPEHQNVYLYCHTGYPDVGWDIPDLILEYGLASKVLLTYKCKHCGNISASFFHDAVNVCGKCRTLANQPVGVTNKIEEEDLAKIYNLFDVYIQWANSEGFGMSQPEAARCGLPVISVNYSAMKSFVENVGGIGIDPVGYYKELETGCHRAIPDENALAAAMYRMVAFPDYRNLIGKQCLENYHKVYHWDKAAKIWADYFLSQPLKDINSTWYSPPRIFNPATTIPEGLENMAVSEQANWLFSAVLGKPEWIGGSMWQRIVKDLTYRASMSNDIPGYYFNDLSHPDIEKKYDSFNLSKAHALLSGLRQNMNGWEKARYEKNKIHQ